MTRQSSPIVVTVLGQVAEQVEVAEPVELAVQLASALHVVEPIEVG